MTETRWRVLLARRAEKDLDRLDPQIRGRVVRALRGLTDRPGSAVVKLKGRPESRLRVGDWRAIVELDHGEKTVRVKRVLPRGRAYER